MSDRFLRARDVAECLDVSIETVLRWHRAGKLPGGRRFNGVLRFDRDELEAWLESTRTQAALPGVTSRNIIPGLLPGKGGWNETANVGASSAHG